MRFVRMLQNADIMGPTERIITLMGEGQHKDNVQPLSKKFRDAVCKKMPSEHFPGTARIFLLQVSELNGRIEEK
jgi:hypothetical protein